MRRLRDLDYDMILKTVAAATDKTTRLTRDGLMNADLSFIQTPADSVSMLRNAVMLAAVRHTNKLEDLRADQLLVQALARIQHHPLAKPFTRMKVREGLSGPDAGPRLRELVDQHAELGWDADEVQRLILREITEVHGDHELDDTEPPWLLYWGPASDAAAALMLLVTLRELDDL